ncbi:hypothetical protein FOL47_002289, partial [Perkinsus chesapeaki]
MSKKLSEKVESLKTEGVDKVWSIFSSCLCETAAETSLRFFNDQMSSGQAPKREPRPKRRLRKKAAIDAISNSKVIEDRWIWKHLRENFDVYEEKKIIPKTLSARAFSEYMNQLYNARGEDPEGMPPTIIKDGLAPERDPSPMPADITLNEISDAVRTLKTLKAPGIDGCPPEALKIGSGVAKWLLLVCQKCFEEETQPEQWNTSKATPIHKRGNKHCCSNYRTVLSQCAATKVFGMIILSRIYSIVTGAIDISQAAFRKGRSGLEIIHTLRLLLDGCHKYNLELHLLSIDYTKAFDTISRQHIWDAMISAGVHPKYIRIMRNSYESARAQIYLNNQVEEVRLNHGVRQGDGWSPILFILGLEDILSQEKLNGRVTRQNKICQKVGQFLTDLSFADDVTIPSSSAEDSEIMYNYLEEDSAIAELKTVETLENPGCETTNDPWVYIL